VEQSDEIVGLAAAKIRLQAQNDRGIWPRPKQPTEGLIQQDAQTLTLIRVCLCEKHSWVTVGIRHSNRYHIFKARREARLGELTCEHATSRRNRSQQGVGTGDLAFIWTF
jgi:hypothetical protein